jgi:hypothetical protein
MRNLTDLSSEGHSISAALGISRQLVIGNSTALFSHALLILFGLVLGLCDVRTYVMYNESRHTKFTFSYLEHVTLLTLAQARLSPYSGFSQGSSPLLALIAIFGKIRRSLPSYLSQKSGP